MAYEEVLFSFHIRWLDRRESMRNWVTNLHEFSGNRAEPRLAHFEAGNHAELCSELSSNAINDEKELYLWIFLAELSMYKNSNYHAIQTELSDVSWENKLKHGYSIVANDVKVHEYLGVKIHI